MIITDDPWFQAFLKAVAKMKRSEREKKLKADGSLKLVVGLWPTKTIAEFKDAEEERKFIQCLIDFPSMADIKEMAQKMKRENQNA